MICAISKLVEGVVPLNTQSLRCFQVIQGISRVAVVRPFFIGLGVFRRAERHQSDRDSSLEGALHGRRSQDRLSCHTCLEKEQFRRRCWIDSGS